MENIIKLGKKVFIRNVGRDEFWLQDIIYKNPNVLGFGELIPINKEKKQISGGRLDILLKDPEDDSMYEIEVMLGESDPSHIIRSIEYWDNEKRRYPQRQHFCVLIAESFERRYFNVIQLLSLSIPMIAIQANLLEVDGDHILNFSKIMDIYIEPEDEEEGTPETEKTWPKKANWTLATANALKVILSKRANNVSMGYTQSYISIKISGRISYTLSKLAHPSTRIAVKVKGAEQIEAMEQLLSSKAIDSNYIKKYQEITFTIDQKYLKENQDILLESNDLKHKENKREE